MNTSPTSPTPGHAFAYSRTLAAPRTLVWKVWSEAEHLARWFGPKGFTISVARLDFRVGGMFHYCMQGADGGRMWGRFIFREIVAPERIVWVNSFSDESGALVKPPFDDPWPREMLTTVTFTEHDGRTIVSLKSTALHATDAEQKTFDDNHDSMNQGWAGTFDRLESHLAGL